MSRDRRVIPAAARPRRPGSGSGRMARRRAIEASEPPRRPFDEIAHNASVLLDGTSRVDDALHLECVASGFLPYWADGPAGINLPFAEASVLRVLEQVESAADEVALTALRGVEAIAEAAIAEAASAAAWRLIEQGIAAPPWVWQVGQAQTVEARLSGNDEDASLGVIVEYAYPDGSRHSLASFVADDMGGAIKFMGLMQPFDRAVGGEDLRLVDVDPEDAHGILREALQATDQLHARFGGDPSVASLGALAWSRVRE